MPIPASNIKLAVLIPCMLFSASSWATDIQCEHYSALYVLRGSGTYTDATGITARFADNRLL